MDQSPLTAVQQPQLILRPGLRASQLAALQRHMENDPNEFLKDRYLSIGGGLLLVGPTGIGKSSLSMQLMINWALGEPAFQIRAARPLRSLLIQAENDNGDLAEMRDGVVNGLNLNDEQKAQALENIYVHQETSASGAEFFNSIVQPLLAAHTPDLLWIDPALAYIGGETTSQADVGSFLRNNLHPFLRLHRCAAIIVHHTNKPPSQRGNRKKLSPLELAYSGSGSAEWANWSRAVLVMEQTDVRDVFYLHAAKRGNRLKWEASDGGRTTSKLIAHSLKHDEIFWRSVTDDEEQRVGQPPSVTKEDDVMALVPATGQIETKKLEALVTSRLGIGQRAAKEAIKRLANVGKIFRWSIPRQQGGPHEVHWGRDPQPEAQIPKTKARASSLLSAGNLDNNDNEPDRS